LAEPINEETPAELFSTQLLDRRPGVNTMSVPKVGKFSKVGTVTTDKIQNLVFKRHVTPRDPADYAFNTLTTDEDDAKPPSEPDWIAARKKLRDQIFGPTPGQLRERPIRPEGRTTTTRGRTRRMATMTLLICRRQPCRDTSGATCNTVS
jgi:hypothetical protein